MRIGDALSTLKRSQASFTESRDAPVVLQDEVEGSGVRKRVSRSENLLAEILDDDIPALVVADLASHLYSILIIALMLYVHFVVFFL